MTKTRILVLEDSKSDMELIGRKLTDSDLNCTIETVHTREAYEQALDDFKPDLILADYSLPTFNGIRALEIRQQKSPHVPFIIVSGTIEEEDAIELIRNGVTDYVLKDKLSVLVEKIKHALTNAQELNAKRDLDDKLRSRNEKLEEIVLLQSQKLSDPVAQILSLCKLFKFDNPSDPANAEVLGLLKSAAETLADVINDIKGKTAELSEIQDEERDQEAKKRPDEETVRRAKKPGAAKPGMKKKNGEHTKYKAKKQHGERENSEENPERRR